MAVSWALGANLIMSEAWPTPHTPRASAICSGAGESVCCRITSAPWSISTLAASRSLPGSNHELIQTTFTSMSGLTLRAASVVALMPRTTSGMGNEAT